MSVFLKARSLFLTSFANKCLNIGLGLLPMLLVEHQVSSSTSSWVMGFVKTAAVTGSILGGWLSDRLGLKQTLILAFLLSALGLITLPLTQSVLLMCIAGMVAQAGQGFFGGTAKMYLTLSVEPSERQEAIGWLRMFNNGAQIFSYGVGWIFSKLGILVLMFFDAGASLVAAFIGIVFLRDIKKEPKLNQAPGVKLSTSFGRSDWKLLFFAVMTVGIFDFIYEMVMVGIAAKYKLVFGQSGLEVFSQSMIINTVLCTVFSVGAARWFTRLNVAIPIGLVLNTVGAVLCLSGDISKEKIFIGMFILTLGEIAFFAVASYMILQLTPNSKNQGAFYGTVLSIERMSRIAGGAAAFPWVVHGSYPALILIFSGVLGIIFWLMARKGLEKLSVS